MLRALRGSKNNLLQRSQSARRKNVRMMKGAFRHRHNNDQLLSTPSLGVLGVLGEKKRMISRKGRKARKEEARREDISPRSPRSQRAQRAERRRKQGTISRKEPKARRGISRPRTTQQLSNPTTPTSDLRPLTSDLRLPPSVCSVPSVVQKIISCKGRKVREERM